MTASITLFDHRNPPVALADTTVLYTDLDGSFLAPGGTIMTSHDGTPSLEALEHLLALREAGVEVVIVTGRNRAQCAEISRLLGVDTFIGELGGFTSYTESVGQGSDSRKHRTLVFDKGAWASLPEGSTPHEQLELSGAIDRLCALYPGRAERVIADVVNQREVSVLILGNFDVTEAAEAISAPEMPVRIIDNGEVSPANHGLDLEDGIHIYHVLPAGINKEAAVARDIERRGIERARTLAIGDSCGDIGMAEACGTFVLVGNGLGMAEVQEGIQTQGIDILAVRERTIDGWTECARAILAAKGR